MGGHYNPWFSTALNMPLGDLIYYIELHNEVHAPEESDPYKDS